MSGWCVKWGVGMDRVWGVRDVTYLLRGVVKLVCAGVVSSLATTFASNNRSRGYDNISCIY